MLILLVVNTCCMAQTFRAASVEEGQYWVLLFSPGIPVVFGSYNYDNHKWTSGSMAAGVAAHIIFGKGNGTGSEIAGRTIVSGGIGMFQGQTTTAALILGIAGFQACAGYDFGKSSPMVGFGMNINISNFTTIGSSILWKKKTD